KRCAGGKEHGYKSEPAESEDGTHARGAPNGAANEVMCAPGIQRVGRTGDKSQGDSCDGGRSVAGSVVHGRQAQGGGTGNTQCSSQYPPAAQKPFFNHAL